MINRLPAVTFCICFAFTSPTWSQVCPEFIGEWGYGPTRSVAMAGELAAMDSGPKLLVADLSMPAGPSLDGELPLPGEVEGIAIEGDTIFVATEHTEKSATTLIAVDATDPDHPTLLDSLETPNSPIDIAVENGIAYVTSWGKRLTVIDVSNPADLRILSVLALDEYRYAVDVENNHVYLAGFSGLTIVNAADPESPFVEARRDAPGGIDLATTPDRLYHLSYQELLVFDISDGADPQRRGSYSDVFEPDSVAVDGTTAFVADNPNNGRLQVIDASDPDTPVKIGQFQQDQWMNAVAASENVVLVSASQMGSRLIDVSDPSSPELGADLPPPAPVGYMTDIVVRDGLAFLADTGYYTSYTSPTGKLRIVDVSSGPGFTEIAHLDLPGAGYAIALYDHYAVVAQGVAHNIQSGLDVIDVSDPTAPVITGGVGFIGWPLIQVVVSGDHAFITNEWLSIVDLSDPTMPTVVSSTTAPGGSIGTGFKSVGVVDDRAYLATGEQGMCVYDLTDLIWPEELGCTPTLDRAHWVAVSDGRAYVTAGTSSAEYQLLIFDITGEGPPVQIGSFLLWDLGHTVSVSDGLAFVETTQRGLLMIDVSDPAAPVLLGTVPDQRRGIGVDDILYTIPDTQGLHAYDLSSCAGALPTADFHWSPYATLLSEEFIFADTSAGSPTSWLWDFGDGNTSQDQNPRHTYALPGYHNVTLTVGNAVGTDTEINEVEVRSIASPSCYSHVIPAVAHGAGKANTTWRSNLVIDLPESRGNVAAYLMKPGQDNSLQPGKRIELPQGSTPLDDVVASLFGEDDTTGSIFLTAGWDLNLSSRTYTLSGDGSFGQFIPGIDGTGYAYTEPPVLIQLTQNDDFRTNLGLVNLGEPAIDVSVEFFTSDSTQLGSAVYSLEPFGHLQINEFITAITAAPVDDGYALLNVSNATPTNEAGISEDGTPGGATKSMLPPPPIAYAAYASTIDNRTGDPVFMLPAIPSADPLWIPAVAHVEGRNGTIWRTDLEVCGVRGTDSRFRLELLETGEISPDPPSETFTLESGTCVRYRDVVQSVFGSSTTGALRVLPEAGMLTASSRTYTQRADGGTYGQFVAAVRYSDVFEDWPFAHLIQLSQSADRNRGFRTNVGLVNASSFAIDIELRIQTHDMVTLEELTVQLQAFEHRQLNRVLQDLDENELENVRIEVRTTTFDGRFLTYASVVDNITGDAIYIPGQ